MMQISRLLLSLAIILTVDVAFAADKLQVFVSVLPQRYFVQQIGKELVHVEVMVQPGASPATYEPKSRQMARISGAQIYFAIGVPFERVWLPRISASNQEMVLVHTDQGIEKLIMSSHHHHDAPADSHDHGADTKHDDGHEETAQHHDHKKGHAHGEEHAATQEKDPHIWLSPPLVKKQALTMLKALQHIDPARSKVYETNYRQFVSRIDALDHKLKLTFGGNKGLQFMVFHPSWGYFAESYGLRQIPIEIEGKDPKPAQLKALIEHAREEGIRVIFAQPQFSSKSATLIAKAIGGQVVFADPLAADWMANLLEVADKFKAALK